MVRSGGASVAPAASCVAVVKELLIYVSIASLTEALSAITAR